MLSKLMHENNTDEKRCSGDTLGRAMTIIGSLMDLSKPYHTTIEASGEHLIEDFILWKTCKALTDTLTLEHFYFNKCGDTYTVVYDIWRD